jgi:uncharacterized protein (TIGR03083 family)
MEVEDYITALRREGRLLGHAAAQANLEAPVAACPGWNVADLLWHIGDVHDFWGRVVASRAADRGQVPPGPDRPADAELLAWYRAGLDRLADLLAAADPAIGVWTWASQKDVAFVQRRMPLETAVHRVDAEVAATGSPSPIDPALAVDGIDEFFQVFTGGKLEDAAPLGGSVHLHATDADGEWFVTEAGGRLEVSHGHTRADAAARGAGADLLLALWRRRHGPIDVHGDQAVLDRLLARTDLDRPWEAAASAEGSVRRRPG